MKDDKKITNFPEFFKNAIKELNSPFSKSNKIATNVVNGLVISTVQLHSGKFETAVIDQKDFYTVEQYKTLNEAKSNHLLWCEKAKHMQYLISKNFLGKEQLDEHILKIFNQY